MFNMVTKNIKNYLKVYLPYDPSSPSIGRSVGLLSNIISFVILSEHLLQYHNQGKSSYQTELFAYTPFSPSSSPFPPTP